MHAKDLANSLAESQGLTGAAAVKVVDALMTGIADAVAAGEEISLPEFGKFKVKDMAERSGRNPATAEAITIAASKKLTFAPAKAMKERL